MRPSIQQACESVMAKLLYTGAQVEMLMPPKNVLSDEQQVQLYLTIVGNPLAVAVLKLQRGEEEYAAWRSAMEAKAELLGMQSLNVAQLSRQEREDIQQVAQEQGESEPLDTMPDMADMEVGDDTGL